MPNTRRTFAIISHPDAGKTTLTEKLLLFGGAIQMAGMVKARGDNRRARSDWLKVEQERGISVASSVMTFEYNDVTFNLLDTPGHEDFSEDTYRTLTAVDSAVMVLDAAKGIEAQTLKLFEVCRLRDIPIITFINKMDRDGQDPFTLMDEIAEKLALDVSPMTWPIGMGRDFKGCYDLGTDALRLFDRGKGAEIAESIQCHGLHDPQIDSLIPSHLAETLRTEVEMVKALCQPLALEQYRAGHQTPVFFGSAINNFGVRELLDGIARLAPTPRPQTAKNRLVYPEEAKVSAYIFKIQANMDPKHRDRVAFARICSGTFQKGMKLTHVRTQKQIIVHTPLLFFAQERESVENAYPGDIIGIPNHGNLRIGDTLTEGEPLQFTGIPSFAPELMQRVIAIDPLKAKHVGNALQQLAEEGTARVFKPNFDSGWIVGVVGALQFEILADRLRTEYNVAVKFEAAPYYAARWLQSDQHADIKKFADANASAMAVDHDGDPVFLARNAWHLNDAMTKNNTVQFIKTK